MKLTLVFPADWYSEPHPRPDWLIQKDGTTVGYLYDTKYRRCGGVVDGHVKAIGDDPDIQNILNKWHSKYVAEREAKARQHPARLKMEEKRQRENELAAARRALKL